MIQLLRKQVKTKTQNNINLENGHQIEETNQKEEKDERTNQGIRLEMRKKERYILNKTCD